MDKNKVFIGGLSYDTTEQVLLEGLRKYGDVISIRIVTDRETGVSKGFGFATFKTDDEARKAIEGMSNTIFDGRRIGVKEAIDKTNSGNVNVRASIH